ncbi:MAG: Kazal-type serine protease inhibitor family protein [Henriciella sp.]|nr:Kazal-type serine protease inhibitor family protein [Henriciella sp.]
MKIWAALFAFTLLAACGQTPDETTRPAAEAPVAEAPAPTPPPTPIDATGETCGGIAGIQCPSAYYCQQPDGECIEIMDGAGTCQLKPEVCTREYRPVCGCNGRTYPNACEAAADGMSVAAEGPCDEPDTQ